MSLHCIYMFMPYGQDPLLPRAEEPPRLVPRVAAIPDAQPRVEADCAMLGAVGVGVCGVEDDGAQAGGREGGEYTTLRWNFDLHGASRYTLSQPEPAREARL